MRRTRAVSGAASNRAVLLGTRCIKRPARCTKNILMKSSGKRSEVSIGSRGKPSPHFLSLRKKPDHENIRTNALAGLFERPGREETRKGNDSVDFIGTAPAETPPQDTEAREEVFEEKQVQQDVEEVAPRRRPIVFFLLGAFVLVGAVFVARD